MQGRALVANARIVELLEDDDRIDLLIDLGGGFRYLLAAPDLRAGKVFAPDVKSTVQFVATEPLQKLTEIEYRNLRSKTSFDATAGG